MKNFQLTQTRKYEQVEWFPFFLDSFREESNLLGKNTIKLDLLLARQHSTKNINK